uniref:Uncharacterized protein n=1 Tax=Plectus sambesii TaxID=2011161 RepID=A0A914UNJ0_9BILA
MRAKTVFSLAQRSGRPISDRPPWRLRASVAARGRVGLISVHEHMRSGSRSCSFISIGLVVSTTGGPRD